jgi:hypothetical protein
LLIPLGEFVVPRLRLRHLPTLTSGPTATGCVRARLTADARETADGQRSLISLSGFVPTVAAYDR